jgi:DNA polymerase-3 subunit alpha
VKSEQIFCRIFFCKAHSASYAVKIINLYLKTYYGIEFMVAAINNGGGFYRPEIYIHEAKMSGATIHNPYQQKRLSDYRWNRCVFGFML